MHKRQGFTLIELLIVIGIIAILAAIIFVAVDPARRLAEARNADRWSSVNSILNAYLKYTVDNAGTEPVTLTTDVKYMVGTTNSDCTTVAFPGSGSATQTASNIDLGPSLVASGYLSQIPIDPESGSQATTYYWIKKISNGRILVGACNAEEINNSTKTIQVSR